MKSMSKLITGVKNKLTLISFYLKLLRIGVLLWLARIFRKVRVIVKLSATPLHYNFVKDLVQRLIDDKGFIVLIACDFRRSLIDLPVSAMVIPTNLIPHLNVDFVLTLDTGKAPVHPVAKLIHVPHSLASMHVIYPEGSFDYFDYIFCAGPHHLRELTQILLKRGDKKCVLIPAGYEVVDRLMSGASLEEHALPVILFAPSWGESNVLVLRGEEIVASLLDFCEVVLRPHVMSVTEDAKTLDAIRLRFGNHPRFSLDLSADSSVVLRRADLLISDWSGVAFEYALALLRPVIFINGPMKVFNHNWSQYLDEPGVEMTARSEIGMIVDKVNDLPFAVNELLSTTNAWKEKILRARDYLLFHPAQCAEMSHNALKLLANHQTEDQWVQIRC